MSENSLDSLKFVIEGDVEGDLTKFDKLADSMTKAKNSLKGFREPKALMSTIDKLKDISTGGVSDLAALSNALSKLGNVKISSTVPKRLTEISTAIAGLDDGAIGRVERLANAMSTLSEASAGIRAAGIRAALRGENNDVVTNEGEANAPAGGNGLASRFAGMSQVFFNDHPALAGIQRITSALGGLASTVSGVTSKVWTLTKVFGRRLAPSIAASVKTYTSLMRRSFITPLTEGVKKAGEFLGSIKRIAMYRAIRFMFSALSQAMRDGIKNLYQYSALMGGTFANSMNSLATSFTYLKNSMGAMVSPLINSLAGVVDGLIDKFVTLLNVINMVFARLGGASTYTKAVKAAQTYGGAVAGAAGGAGKAMDDLKKTIMGFDELNVLNDQNTSSGGGGGGGGGGADYGSMFEEATIDSSIYDFVGSLRDAFDHGDWVGLGSLLGNKVNELIEKIDWEGAGAKVGYYVNGWFTTAFSLLGTIDFKTLGGDIASMLNGALGQIDFETVGGAVTRQFTSLGTLIIGGFEGIDWKLVAKSVSGFIVGSLKEVGSFLDKTDFRELGSSIVKAISDAVEGTDFAGLTSSIGYLIGEAFSSLGSFVFGIADGLGELFDGGLKSGFKNILSWIWDDIITPFFGGLIDGLGINTDLIEACWELGKSILSEIASPFLDAADWVDKNIIKPVTGAVKKGFNKEPVKFKVEPKNDSKGWWSSVKGWWKGKSDKSNAGKFHTDVSNQSGTWWSNLKGWWKPKAANNAGSFHTDVAGQPVTWWSNLKGFWKPKAEGNAGNFHTGVSNQAGTWWSNVKSWWSDKAGSLETTLKIAFPVIDISWDTVTNGFSKASKPIFNVLKYVFNAKGGIFDGATLMGFMGGNAQIAGEAGREALLPLDQNTGWMDDIAARIKPDSDDQASVVNAINNSASTQNRLLQEQNQLLRQLLSKPTGITTNNIVSALDRQNRRFGTTVIPVNT